MSAGSKLPRPSAAGSNVRSQPTDAPLDDDDDLPLDDGDPNAIRIVYYTLVDFKRAGVPENLIRQKRKTGEFHPVAKTASGEYLFDLQQARAIIDAYWRDRRVEPR